eukprot:IDg10704t1
MVEIISLRRGLKSGRLGSITKKSSFNASCDCKNACVTSIDYTSNWNMAIIVRIMRSNDRKIFGASLTTRPFSGSVRLMISNPEFYSLSEELTYLLEHDQARFLNNGRSPFEIALLRLLKRLYVSVDVVIHRFQVIVVSQLE